MKGMVFAAGLGTRLRPLTNDRPKALVEIAGRTLLEITLVRLRDIGVREVIVNVHHFADMVVDYLTTHGNFGMNIAVSREDDLLLDTGGGLKKAAWFFQDSDEPIILHNVDVVSTIDLAHMVQHHCNHQALATLAVQDRKSSRYLLFDEELRLSGRVCVDGSAIGESREIIRQGIDLRPLAFSGIHVISPRMIPLIEDDGVFSIIPTYLRLASQNEKILGFRADGYYWRDLGTPASLQQAAEDLADIKF